jgi:hypothetical protein
MRKARKIALQLGMAQVGGSDAHYAPEVGLAFTIIDASAEPETVIKAVKNSLCKPYGRAIPLGLRLKRELLAFAKRF